jgi:hypothetical protein
MHHHDNYSKILGNDELKIVGSNLQIRWIFKWVEFHSFDSIWTLEGQGYGAQYFYYWINIFHHLIK